MFIAKIIGATHAGIEVNFFESGGDVCPHLLAGMGHGDLRAFILPGLGA